MPRPLPAVLALLAPTFACRSVTPAGTFFASDPPGAQITIDGTLCDRVTPCTIALDNDERHRVRLELEGYTPREILLVPDGGQVGIPWSEGRLAPNGEPFPLWLAAGDLFVPYRTDDSLAPARVFLRLVRTDE